MTAEFAIRPTNVVPLTRPRREPEPVTFETLPIISVHELAAFWNAGEENRRLAERGADENLAAHLRSK